MGPWGRRKSRVRGAAPRFWRHIAMPRGYQQQHRRFWSFKLQNASQKPYSPVTSGLWEPVLWREGGGGAIFWESPVIHLYVYNIYICGLAVKVQVWGNEVQRFLDIVASTSAKYAFDACRSVLLVTHQMGMATRILGMQIKLVEHPPCQRLLNRDGTLRVLRANRGIRWN